jgi:hypothetical protein
VSHVTTSREAARVLVVRVATFAGVSIMLSAGACSTNPAPQAAAAVDVTEVVRVDAGALRGVVDHGIAAFKGIPYAAPPVGPVRWRAPQPVVPWTGERAADRYGALCRQKYNPKDKGVGALPASEDCLTLNVWAPVGHRAALLAVMFWIHGGGRPRWPVYTAADDRLLDFANDGPVVRKVPLAERLDLIAGRHSSSRR